MRAGIRAAAAAGLLTATLTPAPASGQDADSCLVCHGDPEAFEPDDARLAVDAERWFSSVHGRLELACVACHGDLAGIEEFPHAAPLAPVDCGGCHEDAAAAYGGSVHGYARRRAAERTVQPGANAAPAPTCVTCHGEHDVLPGADPASPTHRLRVAATCASCHGREELRADRIVRLPRMVDAYAHSVHGRRSASGSSQAAVCTDCHGVHELRGTSDPASRIHPLNVAGTCGGCHEEIARQYLASIHGRALAAGIGDSPTCTGCHGEHLILSPSGAPARGSARNLALATCGDCHDDPDLVAKYGLRAGVVGSYVDSYHGWARRRDWEGAATCVECHTAHQVLPASEPTSTIHPDRVAATCGQCHEGADASFAASYSHESASISANPVNRWIRVFYLTLIAVVIGAMAVHNLVIVNYYLVGRRRALARTDQVRRLDRSQLLQHAVLALSFVALVITGFALRFPEAWWVRGLAAVGMNEPVRADLHRFFGLALVALSVYHAHYVLLTGRGRRELRAMLPRVGDLRETLDNLRFHTWRSEVRPRCGRFDYTQKVEYWAVVWGSALMAATGFVLWFPERAAALFPSWLIPAAQTVHYYEAWLATLAILVWHFFFVIFHPDVYPLSWTWLTGTVAASEARARHPCWDPTGRSGETEKASRPEPG